MKKILFFVTLFFILSYSSYLLLSYEKEQKIEAYLNDTTTQYKQNYQVLYDVHKTLSKIIFDTRINTPEVINIFKQATMGTLEEKESARDTLYLHLKETYSLLKQYNIKQLHFHLPNNDSYLRFHRPKKFGDNLSSIRNTVKYVNKYKKPVDGFEEGRIYNGYRFVFPLFYKKKHIGSVEVSFSTLAINKEFMKDYDVTSNFLILRSVVEQKVFNDEKNNYTPSLLRDFYLEKAMVKHITKIRKIKTKQPLSQRTKNIVIQKEHDPESFSLYDDKRQNIMTFIKVQNPISKKVIGLFVIRSNPQYIYNKTNNFYTFLSLINLFFALILLYFYKATIYKAKLEDSNKKFRKFQEEITYLNQTLEEKVSTQVKEIKEANAFHETIFNTVNDGIAILDLESNFILVNDAYEKITGYTKKELYSKSCIGLTVPSMIEESIHIVSQVATGAICNDYTKSCISKNGKKLDVKMDIVLMPNKKQILIAVKDMTLENQLKLDKIAQEQQLLQQSRFAQMGEMISMIAHQWRQPLSAISSTASNLDIKIQLETFDLDTKEGQQEQNKYFTEHLHNIDTYVHNLSTTIDDFRDFYKPNKLSVKASLEYVIIKALNIIKASLINDNIEVIYEYNSEKELRLYANEMMQVILNILKNAQDNFIEKNIQDRQIIIGTHDNTINIYDNGGGIDPDIIDNIFDPYFSTKDDKNGTGIGLYMSKLIIEDHHHGTLKAENIDEGVCFTIILSDEIE